MTSAASRAWGWRAHLLEGGVTPWREFSGPGAAPAEEFFPGAAQLELARRFNEVGSRPDVVRRILETGGPGRGRQELPLPGLGLERTWGPAPMDPQDVPVEELIRIGLGVLVESLATAPMPPPPAAPRQRWLDRFRGPGVLTLPLVPVDRLLRDAWIARVRQGPVMKWSAWTAKLARLDRVPRELQFEQRATQWLATGFRRRVELTPVDETPRTDPAAAELVRQLHPLLAGLVPAQERQALNAAVLAPWLDHHVGGAELVLPRAVRPWALELADRIAADVRRAGYPVRGDVAVLHEIARRGRARPKPAEILALTLQVLDNGWETGR